MECIPQARNKTLYNMPTSLATDIFKDDVQNSSVQACFDYGSEEFNKPIYNLLTIVSHTMSRPGFLLVTLSDTYAHFTGLAANGPSLIPLAAGHHEGFHPWGSAIADSGCAINHYECFFT
jgi:hypothetical protein